MPANPQTPPGELLACPWCGTTEHLHVQSVGVMTGDMPDRPYRVVCTHIDHDTITGPVTYGKQGARIAWNARLAHAKEQAAGVDHLAASIAEVMAEDGGCWRPCSGCQESVDGCVSYTDYPYSETFKCQPGAGCGECGGIGVLWEDGAFLAGYADLALDDDDDTPAPASSVGEGMVLVPAEMPRAMMDAGQDYINSVAFMGSHVLPAQFRWVDFWSAILAAAPDVRVGTSGCLRNALVALLDTSGARGTYHALKYAEAVENAERILASTPDRAPAPADLVEAFEQAHALIQEAKGLADGPQGGSVTDHLDFAEHWLAKAEELALAALRSPDDLAKGRGK